MRLTYLRKKQEELAYDFENTYMEDIETHIFKKGVHYSISIFGISSIVHKQTPQNKQSRRRMAQPHQPSRGHGTSINI